MAANIGNIVSQILDDVIHDAISMPKYPVTFIRHPRYMASIKEEEQYVSDPEIYSECSDFYDLDTDFLYNNRRKNDGQKRKLSISIEEEKFLLDANNLIKAIQSAIAIDYKEQEQGITNIDLKEDETELSFNPPAYIGGNIVATTLKSSNSSSNQSSFEFVSEADAVEGTNNEWFLMDDDSMISLEKPLEEFYLEQTQHQMNKEKTIETLFRGKLVPLY